MFTGRNQGRGGGLAGSIHAAGGLNIVFQIVKEPGGIAHLYDDLGLAISEQCDISFTLSWIWTGLGQIMKAS